MKLAAVSEHGVIDSSVMALAQCWARGQGPRVSEGDQVSVIDEMEHEAGQAADGSHIVWVHF